MATGALSYSSSWSRWEKERELGAKLGLDLDVVDKFLE